MAKVAGRVLPGIRQVEMADIVVHFDCSLVERDGAECAIMMSVGTDVQYHPVKQHRYQRRHEWSQRIIIESFSSVSCGTCHAVAVEYVSVGGTEYDRRKPLRATLFKHIRRMEGNDVRRIVNLDDMVW